MATYPILERRRQSRFATVKKYLDSGLPQKQFCQQEKIAYSTLLYWLRRYRESNGNTPPSTRKPFVELKFKPPVQSDSPYYTIHYPNGVLLHVHGTIPPEVLLVLIQAS